MQKKIVKSLLSLLILALVSILIVACGSPGKKDDKKKSSSPTVNKTVNKTENKTVNNDVITVTNNVGVPLNSCVAGVIGTDGYDDNGNSASFLYFIVQKNVPNDVLLNGAKETLLSKDNTEGMKLFNKVVELYANSNVELAVNCNDEQDNAYYKKWNIISSEAVNGRSFILTSSDMDNSNDDHKYDPSTVDMSTIEYEINVNDPNLQLYNCGVGSSSYNNGYENQIKFDISNKTIVIDSSKSYTGNFPSNVVELLKIQNNSGRNYYIDCDDVNGNSLDLDIDENSGFSADGKKLIINVDGISANP